MPTTYNILILGASYGSLLGTKLALAGHTVHLVCLPVEADLINREGAIVRLPVQGRTGLVEINSQKLPGHDTEACRSCYTDPTVWDSLDPVLMTLCSPDPQAFRPPEDQVNVLQVRLPTNFKAARFEANVHTAMLRQLESDIEVARFDAGDGPIALPVKLKVHDSVFVPLAKWSMLIAGNYRCVQPDSMRSIREAVHSGLAAARAIYNWVGQLCMALGAAEPDLVPFDKYAQAALSLVTPSSAARALANGAPHIERVDRLVQTIAAQYGMRSDMVNEIVTRVDGWLEANRAKAA